MEILYLILIGFGCWLFGVISCPFIIFLRARKDGSWDDSNMTNIIRLVAHIATHPSDFGLMKYDDGTYPFWYINKDEFRDIVKTRPKGREFKK